MRLGLISAVARILCCFVTFTTFCRAQDQCSSLIPAAGAYRIVQAGGQTKTFSSAKDWFCSNDFMSYAQQNQAKGGVSIPTEAGIVSANFDSSNQQQVQQRSQFCQDNAKTFSQTGSEFLFIKEGDPVLVKGFTDCIAQSRRQFLTASGKQETQNVFSVAVGANYYPGPEPSILSVTPVDGATVLSAGSFAPATKIPFNAAPLTGLYKFDQNSPDAMVLVSTTLGDVPVKVSKCRKTLAGTWQITKKATLSREVPSGTYSVAYQLPQASCHPHCGNGDWQTRDMVVGGDLSIRNPRFGCAGGGCPFDVDQGFTQDSEKHIKFTVRVRSLSDTYTLVADQFRHEQYEQEQLLSQGSLTFGNTISFNVPDDATLTIDAAWGVSTVTPSMLKANNLGPTSRWLRAAGPVIGGNVYSYDVVDANCTQ